jgi:hypothetical protein
MKLPRTHKNAPLLLQDETSVRPTVGQLNTIITPIKLPGWFGFCFWIRYVHREETLPQRDYDFYELPERRRVYAKVRKDQHLPPLDTYNNPFFEESLRARGEASLPKLYSDPEVELKVRQEIWEERYTEAKSKLEPFPVPEDWCKKLSEAIKKHNMTQEVAVLCVDSGDESSRKFRVYLKTEEKVANLKFLKDLMQTLSLATGLPMAPPDWRQVRLIDDDLRLVNSRRTMSKPWPLASNIIIPAKIYGCGDDSEELTKHYQLAARLAEQRRLTAAAAPQETAPMAEQMRVPVAAAAPQAATPTEQTVATGGEPLAVAAPQETAATDSGSLADTLEARRVAVLEQTLVALDKKDNQLQEKIDVKREKVERQENKLAALNRNIIRLDDLTRNTRLTVQEKVEELATTEEDREIWRQVQYYYQKNRELMEGVRTTKANEADQAAREERMLKALVQSQHQEYYEKRMETGEEPNDSDFIAGLFASFLTKEDVTGWEEHVVEPIATIYGYKVSVEKMSDEEFDKLKKSKKRKASDIE